MGCRKSNREVVIRERFFLGGVSSLRGFDYKGVGHRAQRRAQHVDGGKGGATSSGGDGGGTSSSGKAGSDALGGDLFATLRAAVRSMTYWCICTCVQQLKAHAATAQQSL
jgi:outer membrane protein assembly factor BamA